MKGSKRTFESPMIRVPSCIYLPENYDVESVDNRLLKRLKMIKFEDDMFADD